MCVCVAWLVCECVWVGGCVSVWGAYVYVCGGMCVCLYVYMVRKCVRVCVWYVCVDGCVCVSGYMKVWVGVCMFVCACIVGLGR